MNAFAEKIVARRLTAKHYLTIGCISLAVPVVFVLLLSIPFISDIVMNLALLVIIGLVYGAYQLIRSMLLEYEYTVTNGDIDIDVIIAKSRRKRLFSVSAKEIEIIARYQGSFYPAGLDRLKTSVKSVSSMEDEGIYFIKASHKGQAVAAFFQPDERMLDIFKMSIPSKVYKEDIRIQG
ncbi:MAG: DUF6106 family protein [Eubacteriales bacterium]|nr:DUF6106 family protein [Eubacteriales bacterium]